MNRGSKPAFSNRVCVVTGGAAGIGLCIARRFQEAVLAALQGGQPVLAAVKNRNDPFLQAVRGVPGVRVLYITRENREGLFRLLERDFCR